MNLIDPILFLGSSSYQSIAGAAAKLWNWLRRRSVISVKSDLEKINNIRIIFALKGWKFCLNFSVVFEFKKSELGIKQKRFNKLTFISHEIDFTVSPFPLVHLYCATWVAEKSQHKTPCCYVVALGSWVKKVTKWNRSYAPGDFFGCKRTTQVNLVKLTSKPLRLLYGFRRNSPTNPINGEWVRCTFCTTSIMKAKESNFGINR